MFRHIMYFRYKGENRRSTAIGSYERKFESDHEQTIQK